MIIGKSFNMQKNQKPKPDKSSEADRILERVKQESETVGTSSFGRVADRIKGHMGAEDSDPNDWAEVWGTRIGRGLALIFFIVLIAHLINTYVFH